MSKLNKTNVHISYGQVQRIPYPYTQKDPRPYRTKLQGPTPQTKQITDHYQLSAAGGLY
jgi:hypothetical protein